MKEFKLTTEVVTHPAEVEACENLEFVCTVHHGFEFEDFLEFYGVCGFQFDSDDVKRVQDEVSRLSPTEFLVVGFEYAD